MRLPLVLSWKVEEILSRKFVQSNSNRVEQKYSRWWTSDYAGSWHQFYSLKCNTIEYYTIYNVNTFREYQKIKSKVSISSFYQDTSCPGIKISFLIFSTSYWAKICISLTLTFYVAHDIFCTQPIEIIVLFICVNSEFYVLTENGPIVQNRFITGDTRCFHAILKLK